MTYDYDEAPLDEDFIDYENEFELFPECVSSCHKEQSHSILCPHFMEKAN